MIGPREGTDLPKRHRRLRMSLTGVTVGLAVVAVVCSVLAAGYQHRIVQASRYNITFDFGQAAAELMRLQLALEQHRDAAAPDAEVALRYGILVNRVKLLTHSRLEGVPIRDDIVLNLAQTVLDIGPAIENLRDVAATRQLIDRLIPFNAPVLRLASMSHSRVGDEIQANQSELGLIFAALCTVTLALVLFGAALIVFVFRQNGNLDRVVRTDALTGIANRAAFNAALSRNSRSEQAMILLDVDHFKSLNDTLGHSAGDRFLIELSRRLTLACADAALIARIGGDEFAISYAGSQSARRSIESCERILLEMRRPFLIDGRQVRSSVTLGVSVGSADARDDDGMMFRHADIALYEAKNAGRDRAMNFEPEMNQQLVRRQRLQGDLRDAVSRNELSLAYQPIVDLTSGRTRGFEALLRWHHHELGHVSPAEFIPIAEESGQIIAVGRWVIDVACRQAALWPSDIFIAVNVSAAQLSDASLTSDVKSSLDKHGIPARRLEIEITESTLIENDERALAVLHDLRRMGCRVALDDFGTGYSSLSYLRRFPFDKIKIDQSFLRCQQEEGIAIIAGTCDLARRLNLVIVAEGIESYQHRQIVEAAGCDLGQGYLFDRPLSAEGSMLRLMAETETGRQTASVRPPLHEAMAAVA